MSAILDHHAWLGGDTSPLGPTLPGQGEMPAAKGGAVQRFRHGRIYWQAKTGAHEVHGAILAAYLRPGGPGGPGGFLGYPTSDEQCCHDQVGRLNRFEGGVIFWHPDTGAHEIHGAILAKWRSLGSERSVLGYPTSDELGHSTGKRGEFQHGAIIWSGGSGAHELHHDIWSRFQSYPLRMSLGFPTCDETPTADGVGRVNLFTNGGSIRWTPSGGAVVQP